MKNRSVLKVTLKEIKPFDLTYHIAISTGVLGDKVKNLDGYSEELNSYIVVSFGVKQFTTVDYLIETLKDVIKELSK